MKNVLVVKVECIETSLMFSSTGEIKAKTERIKAEVDTVIITNGETSIKGKMLHPARINKRGYATEYKDGVCTVYISNREKFNNELLLENVNLKSHKVRYVERFW